MDVQGRIGVQVKFTSFELKNFFFINWTSRSTNFKEVVERYGAQFRSSTQHDAQEFLFWLLDKVHEDLNTATKRKYKNIKNNYGRPDEVIAAETLANYVRCNNSFVQAVFRAQFRSSLTCPRCHKQSNTFGELIFGFIQPWPDSTTTHFFCRSIPLHLSAATSAHSATGECQRAVRHESTEADSYVNWSSSGFVSAVVARENSCWGGNRWETNDFNGGDVEWVWPALLWLASIFKHRQWWERVLHWITGKNWRLANCAVHNERESWGKWNEKIRWVNEKLVKFDFV